MELSTVIKALHERQDYAYANERAGKRGGYVTDYASEYGEPGYSSTGPVLLGSYWCSCPNGPDAERENARAAENGSKPRYLHGMECHYPRVFALLESAGCELEWYDEWVIPSDSDKCYRTTGDSYSWQPTAVWNDDIGDYMIPDDDPSVWIEWAENNASRCLMSAFSHAELESVGYVERQCGYASGWHPGMNDDPTAIAAAINAEHPTADIIFQLSETSQFYIMFCVWVREEGSTDDAE